MKAVSAADGPKQYTVRRLGEGMDRAGEVGKERLQCAPIAGGPGFAADVDGCSSGHGSAVRPQAAQQSAAPCPMDCARMPVGVVELVIADLVAAPRDEVSVVAHTDGTAGSAQHARRRSHGLPSPVSTGPFRPTALLPPPPMD